MEGLSPEEVIKDAKGRGYDISRKTLYNYEKELLISQPIFRDSKNTIYPKAVTEELIRAWEAVRYVQNNRYKLARKMLAKE